MHVVSQKRILHRFNGLDTHLFRPLGRSRRFLSRSLAPIGQRCNFVVLQKLVKLLRGQDVVCNYKTFCIMDIFFNKVSNNKAKKSKAVFYTDLRIHVFVKFQQSNMSYFGKALRTPFFCVKTFYYSSSQVRWVRKEVCIVFIEVFFLHKKFATFDINNLYFYLEIRRRRYIVMLCNIICNTFCDM